MSRFDYFVIYADMRTGSNFLEANLNLFDGLTCHGEAFNGHFVGYPDAAEILGVDLATRDRDPWTLLNAIRAEDGLAGFRFFHDHDPRVLEITLGDPRCAKIVLTRNPVDSYVSTMIARATGQWKLTNVAHARSEQVTFDPLDFAVHLSALQDFQLRIMNTLQQTGQTAFYVAYEDLQDVAVMNGLARFLGAQGQITQLSSRLKKQNPAPLASKVGNFAEMEQALAQMDLFNLNRTPNFEPRRGGMIPTYLAAARSPLLFMPLKSGPTGAVCDWLARLDQVAPSDLLDGFTQKTLRDWQAARPGHRRFTVLRHPVAWAHAAFCDRIVANGPGSFDKIRATLRKVHKVEVPDTGPDPETDADYTMQAHRAAFLAFLRFLRANLSAQTGVRVDPAWGSQLTTLQGMSGFAPPDMILREDRLRADLAILAGQVGHKTMPPVPEVTDPHAQRLAAIYDDEIEAAARAAFGRDYTAFGFGDYR